EFLDRFYEIRIQKYKERLDILKLKKMKEIAEIEERSRFVSDVIEGKIKVMKVKIEDLRKTMKSMNYKNLDLPKQVNTLDLTRDHVEKLLNDVKEIKKELEELKNTTPGKIWSKEIKEYLNAYKKYYKIDKFIMPEYQK